MDDKGEEILPRRGRVVSQDNVLTAGECAQRGVGAGGIGRPRRPDESGSFWAIAVTHEDLHHGSPLNLSASNIARGTGSYAMVSLARMSWELNREFGTSSAIKLLTID